MSQLSASDGPSIGSFSFNISPSNEHPVLNSSQSKGLSKFFSIPTIQKHQFFALLCFWTYSHICICYWKNNSFDIRDPRLQSDAFALKYTVYFYDTFPLKEQAVFSFTDCSETPAASPSHWPHAGLISLQPAPRLQAATAFHCACAQRHTPVIGEERAEVSAKIEFLSFLLNFLLVVSFPL